jgi:RHS repeat-associated protein
MIGARQVPAIQDCGRGAKAHSRRTPGPRRAPGSQVWMIPFRKRCHGRLRSHFPALQPPRENRRTCFEGPFGEVIRATGPMARANPFRFSTKYQDDESDLLYYGYRYYTAGTGRWLCEDPTGSRGGLNLYGFIDGDPGDYFDDIGRQRGAGPGPSPKPSPPPGRGPSPVTPRPGPPPRPYPPRNPFSPPELKYYYDCNCCDDQEVDGGLAALKQRFQRAFDWLQVAGINGKGVNP